jgi:hypothetical protein
MVAQGGGAIINTGSVAFLGDYGGRVLRRARARTVSGRMCVVRTAARCEPGAFCARSPESIQISNLPASLWFLCHRWAGFVGGSH